MSSSHASLKTGAIGLFLLVVTGLLYRPLLNQQFLTWDDQVNVYRNPHYQPVSLSNTAYFWTHIYNKTYRPLIHTLWAGLAWKATTPPRPVPGDGTTVFDASVFKAANLAVHLLNVLLVWALLHQLGIKGASAGLGALFFALHPLQVEAVAWVTGLNETFCASLCFGSLWFYGRFLKGVAPIPSYLAATGFFILALLCKPAAVALPLVAALLDAFWVRKQGRQALLPVALWLVIAAVWTVVTRLAHPPEDLAQLPSWPVRFLIAGDSWAFYFGKLVWPTPLGIDYGRTPSTLFHSFWGYVAWIVPCGLGVIAWRYRRTYPALGLAVLIVIAWTLPVAGFAPFRFQLLYSTVADRYLYVAMLGPALTLAWGAQRLGKPRYLLLSPLLLVYGWLTAQQLQTWNDNFTFFAHTLRANQQSFMAAANLGVAYRRDNNLDESANYFRRALAIRPGQSEVVLLLAGVLTDQERTDEALPLWREHLRQSPNDAVGWDNVGTILLKKRDLQGALSALNRALHLAPDNAEIKAHLTQAKALQAEMKR